MAHSPSYTSRYNPIEHRFSLISHGFVKE
ncbi:hypothetical protein [Oculatella sp. FACHB-28]